MTQANRVRRVMEPVAIVVLVLAIRGPFIVGLIGSDDIRYIDGAITLASGEPPPGGMDHAHVRVAFVGWLALWVKAGIAPALFWISQLVMEMLAGLALYGFALRFVSRGAAVLAVLLWSVWTVGLVYGGMILPDQMALALGLAGATLAVDGWRNRRSGLLLAAGALLGVAASAKEPFVLLVPLLGGWFIVTGSPRSRGIRAALLLVAAAAGAFGLEYPVLGAWTGDWLFRHRALANAFGVSGFEQHNMASSGGATYYLTGVLLNLRVGGMLGLLALAACFAPRVAARDRAFLVAWALVFFLFLQFGTTDLRHYNHVPKQARYADPIVVPLFVLLAGWLGRVVSSSGFARLGVALLLTVAALHSIRTARRRLEQPLYLQAIPLALQVGLPAAARAGVDSVITTRIALSVPVHFRRRIVSQEATTTCRQMSAVPPPRLGILLPRRRPPVVDCPVHPGWQAQRLMAPVTVLDRYLQQIHPGLYTRWGLYKDVGVLLLPRTPPEP